jgi:hypothetical protein
MSKFLITKFSPSLPPPSQSKISSAAPPLSKIPCLFPCRNFRPRFMPTQNKGQHLEHGRQQNLPSRHHSNHTALHYKCQSFFGEKMSVNNTMRCTKANRVSQVQEFHTLQPGGIYIDYCALIGSYCDNIAGTQNDYCDYPTVMVEVFV